MHDDFRLLKKSLAFVSKDKKKKRCKAQTTEKNWHVIGSRLFCLLFLNTAWPSTFAVVITKYSNSQAVHCVGRPSLYVNYLLPDLICGVVEVLGKTVLKMLYCFAFLKVYLTQFLYWRHFFHLLEFCNNLNIPSVLHVSHASGLSWHLFCPIMMHLRAILHMII